MPRALTPEILDRLPADDPSARRSRRDLRLTNAIMGNHRWLVRKLRGVTEPGEAVLELGAGDGSFAQQAGRAGLAVHALDLSCPAPPGWPADRAWHHADLKTFQGFAGYPVIVGNLIFHHLGDDELRDLGSRFGRECRVILANEPVRRRTSALLFAVVGRLLRADRVTLHDARVSIAAGFRNHELPDLLGLGRDWDIRVRASLLGAYRMIAIRRV